MISDQQCCRLVGGQLRQLPMLPLSVAPAAWAVFCRSHAGLFFWTALHSHIYKVVESHSPAHFPLTRFLLCVHSSLALLLTLRALLLLLLRQIGICASAVCIALVSCASVLRAAIPTTYYMHLHLPATRAWSVQVAFLTRSHTHASRASCSHVLRGCCCRFSWLHVPVS